MQYNTIHHDRKSYDEIWYDTTAHVFNTTRRSTLYPRALQTKPARAGPVPRARSPHLQSIYESHGHVGTIINYILSYHIVLCSILQYSIRLRHEKMRSPVQITSASFYKARPAPNGAPLASATAVAAASAGVVYADARRQADPGLREDV